MVSEALYPSFWRSLGAQWHRLWAIMMGPGYSGEVQGGDGDVIVPGGTGGESGPGTSHPLPVACCSLVGSAFQ